MRLSQRINHLNWFLRVFSLVPVQLASVECWAFRLTHSQHSCQSICKPVSLEIKLGGLVSCSGRSNWTRSYKQNTSLEFDSTLELTREVKIGQVTALIGQFQRRAKFFAGILFIGLCPGLNDKDFTEVQSLKATNSYFVSWTQNIQD